LMEEGNEHMIGGEHLSKAQIEILNDLGFSWMMPATSSLSSFEKRIEDLMDFKARFGHCNVTSTNKNCPYHPLALWCNAIKKNRRLMEEGNEHMIGGEHLSKDQIEILDELGFSWTMPATDTSSLSSFEKRIIELKRFKAKFGHCNVASCNNRPYHSLAYWCNGIRQHRRLMEEGQEPLGGVNLTKDQIEILDGLGFCWTRSKRSPFDKRIEDLMEFKAKFGHCNPSKHGNYGQYQALAKWVSSVQKSRRLIEEGVVPHKHKLTKAQIIIWDDVLKKV
jgi:hypothetical protein